MAPTGCEEHGVATAVNEKGETRLAPLAGLEMVTSAKAGTADTSSARGRMRSDFITETKPDHSSERAGSACKITAQEPGGDTPLQAGSPGSLAIDLIDSQSQI